MGIQRNREKCKKVKSDRGTSQVSLGKKKMLYCPPRPTQFLEKLGSRFFIFFLFFSSSKHKNWQFLEENFTFVGRNNFKLLLQCLKQQYKRLFAFHTLVIIFQFTFN